MPSNEYFKTKQFFDKMTEDGETHDRMSFTEFKHELTTYLIPSFNVYARTSIGNCDIFDIWKTVSDTNTYVERMLYEMTHYEQLVRIKIILRYLHQLGFHLDKYLEKGRLLNEAEFIQKGIYILNNVKEIHNYIKEPAFRMVFDDIHPMYFMDIPISIEFWNKYLIIPETHENNMRLVYRENEHKMMNMNEGYIKIRMSDIDLKAYELDKLNDSSIIFNYRVSLLLNKMLYEHCEYY